MRDMVLLRGGHARVLQKVLRRLGHRIVGYAAPSRDDARIALPNLGRDGEILDQLTVSTVAAALGIGMTHMDERRIRLLEAYDAKGIDFPALVAPGAIIRDGVSLGDASVGLDGAIVTGQETVVDADPSAW